MTSVSRFALGCALGALSFSALFSPPTASAQSNGLDLDRLAALRSVSSVAVAPDGSAIAYGLSVQRRPGVDDDGSSWTELHVIDTATKTSRAFVRRGSARQVGFSADGSHVLFVETRGDSETNALWAIAVDGGEAREFFSFDRDLLKWAVSPDGAHLAFVAVSEPDEDRTTAGDKGFDRVVFEEELDRRELWIVDLPDFEDAVTDPSAPAREEAEPRRIEVDQSVESISWSADGSRLAISTTPRNLVDDRYTLQRVRVIGADGSEIGRVKNLGKLGEIALSPNGRRVAMIAAADDNDPAAGRLSIADATGGSPRDLLPGLEGHVSHVAWRGDDTLIALIDENLETTVARIGLDGTRTDLFRSGDGDGKPNPVVRSIAVADSGALALRGESPRHPAEVYWLGAGATAPERLTNSNPWLDDVELARQEPFRWTSSDGLELEGVLIHPLGGQKPAPTLLMVHGGPEAHDRNGWPTSYSRPGQTAAARGYAVLYPNYRGSTGRGVAFSKTSQGDAAGAEFRDLVEAVDAMIEAGITDGDRVGVTGGSYGGYATAWSSTYATERFAAGAMFVGISNKVSKGFTTDIPNEDRAVHTLFDPWTKWQFSLERSPLYYAEQSRTPLLIGHGDSDTRVHPSQSLQLYRALKLLGNAPVRYIVYPGEGHGNRRAASRYDWSQRILRWFDHFLVDGGEDLPPAEIDLPDGIADADDEAGSDDG